MSFYSTSFGQFLIIGTASDAEIFADQWERYENLATQIQNTGVYL